MPHLFFRPYTPGFRVSPLDEVPGFNVYDDGALPGEPAWFNGASLGSTTPQYGNLASTPTKSVIGFSMLGPKGPVDPAPPVDVPGFQVTTQGDMIGFPIGQQVPGFNIDENGMPRREGPWPSGMYPASAMPQYPDWADARTSTPNGAAKGLYAFVAPSLFNEVRSEDARSTSHSFNGAFEPAADDRESAWARCHVRCVAETVGKGFGPDAPQRYRKCMRECLAEGGYFGY